MSEQYCPRCKQTKPQDCFYPNISWCKTCKHEYYVQYYAEQKRTPSVLQTGSGEFIQRFYKDQYLLTECVDQAKHYISYHNAQLAQRQLRKRGILTHIRTIQA